jgi:hypothetical protein
MLEFLPLMSIPIIPMASSVILLNNHVSNTIMFSQGDKMEAIAYGQQACRYNNELRIGEVYFFKNVEFQVSGLPPTFGLVLPNEYYVILRAQTEILPAGPTISIPILLTVHEFH